MPDTFLTPPLTPLYLRAISCHLSAQLETIRWLPKVNQWLRSCLTTMQHISQNPDFSIFIGTVFHSLSGLHAFFFFFWDTQYLTRPPRWTVRNPLTLLLRSAAANHFIIIARPHILYRLLDAPISVALARNNVYFWSQFIRILDTL